MLRFQVPNMTCRGYAKSVTKALLSVDGVARLEAAPDKREVLIATGADRAALLAILEEASGPAATPESSG